MELYNSISVGRNSFIYNLGCVEMKHRHRFGELGIYVKYCVNLYGKNLCPYAKSRKSGRVKKFVIIDGRGRIPEE